MRVEIADVLVHQREVVRRDFGGDAQPGLLRAAHGFQRLAGREMRDVHVSPGRAGQRDVALDDVRLGGVRHAMQAQAERRRSQVHRAADGHARVLGVLHHRNLQPGGGAQGIAHQPVVENRLAVVGHGHRAGSLERGKIRQLLSQAADGRRGDGKDVDQRAALRSLHPARDLRRVVDRHGVGHGADGGESAGRRRRSSGGDGLLVGLSGLAQMHVQIDEAGSDDASLGVEAPLGLAAQLAGRRHGSHAPVAQQHVHLLIDAARRIDDASACDEQ